jgi:hypothetical protein
LWTESEVTSTGLKKIISEREVRGLERAPLANVSAAEDAVMKLFILNDDVDIERVVDLKGEADLSSYTTPGRHQVRTSLAFIHFRWS